MKLFEPGCTDSPEVKNFLIWLHANAFTEVWQAYDPSVRRLYKSAKIASLDHMAEIARVMDDPWFGVKQ